MILILNIVIIRCTCTNYLVTPGLINTHHHLFQTLTRCVPAGIDATLFNWLKALYPIWGRMGPDEFRVSAALGLGELALSGCTYSSDHCYIFPNGASLSDTIEGAQMVGLRFYATRGSMSIGESSGGLPPDSLVENESEILKSSQDLIDQFNDLAPTSCLRIGVAPCSPFSVSRGLMRDSALLARDKGVRLHTHLAENDEDISYSLEKFGCRPGQYAEELGWVGDDVWHAHCVKLDSAEIDLFARTKTGIAHCPCSNCRLGSGIAPVKQMIDAGLRVGLGVDGSASTDSGNLIAEVRQAMLIQRVSNGADQFSARSALRLATRGGAEVLGHTETGSLEVGKRADFVLWRLDDIALTGAWDPVAALVLCGPVKAHEVRVEGRAIVREGRLCLVDQQKLVEEASVLTKKLMQ